MSITRQRQPLRWYVLAILLLLLLLVGLFFAYRSFVAPPQLKAEKQSQNGYQHRFSLYGFGPERLSKPSDVAIGADGRIYVVDTMNHRVVVYDERGRYVEHFGEQGKGQYQIQFPSGIAVAPDGSVFVLAKQLNKVVVYNPSHKPIKEIMARSPQVATVANDSLYVATDRGVMVGDLYGNLITAFGTRGRQPGQVDNPGGLAVNKEGTVFIADTLNYRVQALGSDGKVLWTVGDAPKEGDAIRNRSRRFGLPVGLALGSDNQIYLIDAFNGVMLVLDSRDGKELARHGEWGHEEGMMYYPSGIAHGAGRTFAVADKFNDRVQVLSVDSPVESPVIRALRSPYAWPLLLALLPLLLLLLPRLRPADLAFLEAIIASGTLPRLADSVPHVNVVADTEAELKDVVQDGVDLASHMRTLHVDEGKAARLAEKYGLDEEASRLLLGAMRPFRLRVVLLTDDSALQKAADAERVTWLSSDNLLEHWGLRGHVPIDSEFAEEG